MYLHYTPAAVQRLFPHYTWHRSRKEKTIYLTFDDGPVPDITPFILEELARYNAKATFFCVGENVRKYPSVFQQLVAAGHRIGNHTFNHLNGLSTSPAQYVKNVEACQQELENAGGIQAGEKMLFRPPYGRIRKTQVRELLPKYELVMWDVLSADFDASLKPEKCLRKSIHHSRNGSIVVFHDNPKAWKNLEYVLPRYLSYMAACGYSFKAL